MVAAKRFPPAVRLGKAAYWSRQAVDEWLRREFGVQQAFWTTKRQ